MTSQPRHPRRIKLINRDFQIGLMAKFIIANTVILAAFLAAFYWFTRSEVEANLHSAHVAYRTVSEMLFPILLTLGLLMVVILSLSIIVVVLYASHRIAGPLYRFHQVLLEMSKRNLKTLSRIREDDQLGEIAQTLGQVQECWSADIRQLRELAASTVAASADTKHAEVDRLVKESIGVLERYDI